jgi:general secretion pathway protein H
MLVVLAIIGVMSSIAVLGLGGAGRGQSAQAEARRLAASIQLASDEALVTERALALNWDGEGYAFVQWDARRNRWQRAGTALGGRHDLPEEMTLAADSQDGPVRIGESGAAAPVSLTITAGSQSWQVRFDGLNATAAPAAGG